MVNDRVRRNGALKMGTDFAVPIASNAAMMRHYHDVLEKQFPGRYLVFGHIGDAHVHVNLLPETPEESARAQRALLDLARHAVALGGTVSAEHGLGKRKAHLLEVQYAPEHIQAMQEVKRRLDPQGLLGRGTLFPSQL
jgi:FAD/FMN-containing dehydrogenase